MLLQDRRQIGLGHVVLEGAVAEDAAHVTGGLLRGFSEASAIRLAARFVALAAEQTLHAGADPRFGVRFEPLLGTLSHWAETPAQPCTDAVFPL